MHNHIKQKRIYCGNEYLEVDIYPRTKNQIDTPKGKRPKKRNVTKPAQNNLNDARAKRYFIQLLNANFGKNDYHLTLTYKMTKHPKSLEDAEKRVRNYISRVNYKRKKMGLKSSKYVIVTEYKLKEGEAIDIHHHIIMDGDLTRDEVEDLWREKKQKGKKIGESIGRTNCIKLQPDEDGVAGLAHYLTKYEYRKRRWTASTNLIKPQEVINDHVFTKRQIEKLATRPLDKDYWEKKYPGYKIKSDYGYVAKYNDIMGWSIYLRLRKDTG